MFAAYFGCQITDDFIMKALCPLLDDCILSHSGETSSTRGRVGKGSDLLKLVDAFAHTNSPADVSQVLPDGAEVSARFWRSQDAGDRPALGDQVFGYQVKVLFVWGKRWWMQDLELVRRCHHDADLSV